MLRSNKGVEIIIDDQELDIFSKYKWNISSKGYVYGYLGRFNNKNLRGYIHRLLLNNPPYPKYQVDHINGNKLDNRRSNLRIVDNSKNHANIGLLKNNKSGYKGVWFCNRNKRKWVANVWCNNIKHHLGCFNTREEAAMAYNNKAIEVFGEYAKLNFIGDK